MMEEILVALLPIVLQENNGLLNGLLHLIDFLNIRFYKNSINFFNFNQLLNIFLFLSYFNSI